MSDNYDVIIIGMGPAGAVASAYLAKTGFKVLTIEKAAFPRYHVGESLTGTAADIIRDLELESRVAELGAQKKTGVAVVGAQARSRFFVPTLRPTWQVRRSNFDALLSGRAEELGVERREGVVQEVIEEDGRVCGVIYKPAGGRHDDTVEARARYVLDCSGQSSLFSRLGIAGSRKVEVFGRQIAVFGQFKNATRDAGETHDATIIFYAEAFHWAWFIPIEDDVVSVGVVMPRETFRKAGSRPEEVLRWGVRNINPDLARRVRHCPESPEARVIRNYSYDISPYVGPGWFCVGDAHRFTDPIFSFGVAFAMTEGKKVAQSVTQILRDGMDEAEVQKEHVEYTTRGQNAGADLIRYFWSYPGFFAYQTRGSLREDFMKLLAGDCFTEKPYPALVTMRESLTRVPMPAPIEGDAESIKTAVRDRRSDLRETLGAYIEHSEEGTRLTFIVDNEDPDRNSALAQLEEELYAEFGRDRLAVVTYSKDLARRLRFNHEQVAGAAPIIEIFSRGAVAA